MVMDKLDEIIGHIETHSVEYISAGSEVPGMRKSLCGFWA